MAVINSVVVGRGKKSVGEVTLAYQRGRTIARRRVVENLSKTESQTRQRTAFKTIVRLTSPYKAFFTNAFQKTKYGSAYNNFLKRNAPRWTSAQFEACAKGNDAWGASDDWGYGFDTAIKVLLNDGLSNLPKNEEQWGVGMPFAGYGDITPVAEIPQGTIKLNLTSGMVLRVMGGDFKGWALDVCAAIYEDGNYGGNAVLYNKTYDLYQNGDMPSLDIEEEVSIGTRHIKVTTNSSTGIIELNMAEAAVIANILGDSLTGSEARSGFVSFTLRKYQQYPKLSYMLFGAAKRTE